MPAAIAGAAMLVVALVAVLAPRDAAGQSVAAIFPPWWDAPRVMAGLGGTDAVILREGAAPSILLLSSQTPGLPERLRAAGALLIVDPTAVAGCLGLDLSPSAPDASRMIRG